MRGCCATATPGLAFNIINQRKLSPGAAQLTYTGSLECGDCSRIILLTVTTPQPLPRPHDTIPSPSLSIVNQRSLGPE